MTTTKAQAELKEGVVTLKETSRTYTFPNGEKIFLSNVTELIVRPSGNHRLRTKDGNLHIIPTGWIHIEIDDTDWTI